MNKPEPLKGKWDVYDNNVPEKCKPCLKTMLVRQAKDDVRSAVEWLKNKMEQHRKSNDLWRLPEDVSWSMAEEWIDEAFEDVMKGEAKEDERRRIDLVRLRDNQWYEFETDKKVSKKYAFTFYI